MDQFRVDALQCGGRDRGEHGRGSSGGERGTPRDHGEVVFDGVEVGVAAVRPGKKAIHAEKVVVEFGFHDRLPKSGAARDELLGGFEETLRGRDAEKRVGFGKFVEEQLQFVGVVVGGHLPQVVGGRHETGEHVVVVTIEAQTHAGGGLAGATDRAEHDVDLVGLHAKRGEERRGEGATAQDVAKRVFGAGALAVGTEFQVAAVVQQGGREAEFKLAMGERRFA